MTRAEIHFFITKLYTHVYFFILRKIAGKNSEKDITVRFSAPLEVDLIHSAIQSGPCGCRDKTKKGLLRPVRGTKLRRKKASRLRCPMMAEDCRIGANGLRSQRPSLFAGKGLETFGNFHCFLLLYKVTRLLFAF
jgi:hypothetical protein